MESNMVTRSTRALAFAALFVFPSLYAMESDSHTHYRITMSGGYRDDNEKLYKEFTGKETMEEFTENYPWYQLDRQEESLEYFKLIKQLLQDKDGKERVSIDEEEKAIVLDLSFEQPVPASAFPDKLFSWSPKPSGRRFPTVKPIQEQEQESRKRSSSGSSSYSPHPNDRTGMKPWHGHP